MPTARLEAALFLFTGILSIVFTSGGNSTHECHRECLDSSAHKVCTYNFKIEWYYSMSKACFDCPVNQTDCSRPHCVATDGSARGIVVANRQLPGPAIHVCESDTVVVNIHNMMTVDSTTIHWHGIHQRDGYAFMDGVPMVTQCPIPPHSRFQYRFVASPAGTHFWHSHSGGQRTDGLMGPLIVHPSTSHDPHRDLYDLDLPEHVIMMHDWLVEVVMNRFTSHHHQRGDNKPRNILINGKGILEKTPDPKTNKLVSTPREVFTVSLGYRYRFRVINSGSLFCPLLLSIDGHNMTIITSDGRPMVPFDVESLVIYAGERFDFILIANNTVGNYWVKVKGLGDCSVKSAKQTAILRYDGSAEEDPTEPAGYKDMDRQGVRLNPLNKQPSRDRVQIVDMNSTTPDDPTSKVKADVQYFVGFDFRKINNPHFQLADFYPLSSMKKNRLYTPQLNNISMEIPPSPPLYQMNDLPQEMFCDSTTAKNCSHEFCECAHTLKVKLNQVAEVILVDEGVTFDASHPMHLHGYSFRVVAQEKVGENVNIEQIKAMDRAGNITRKLSGAVLKDTVIVPDGGYTVVRFYADNPEAVIGHLNGDGEAVARFFGCGSLDQVDKAKLAKFKHKGTLSFLKVVAVQHFGEVIEKCHADTGHCGEYATMKKVKEGYFAVPISAIRLYLKLYFICEHKTSQINTHASAAIVSTELFSRIQGHLKFFNQITAENFMGLKM